MELYIMDNYDPHIHRTQGIVPIVFRNFYGQDVSLEKLPAGKPKIRESLGFDFNISHADKMMICGVTRHGMIGVDIEKVTNIDVSIASEFLTHEERHFLMRNGNGNVDDFFRLWTLKEAFVKAIGTGITDDLKAIQFDESVLHQASFSLKEWHFRTLMLGNYRVSICTSEPQDELRFIPLAL
ncbi:4'-phosphopantetheinyl transferase family protein [Alicyclobacillus acidoterrestris]|uniref:4'-phosphopantetheinyl transferase superfamily protein n=1 Tax=Alicyclobacillus acidoterrestris (strain ATCC 49025 / DSM 3922 / CIP 106132 / NCIMB 13137 / GD3B) TaxID=1356854 RepID=A0A9E7CZK7_ALIAG|nr:4'-phosphopantetheinyl transferase superfamily protein [Alicyclobacillus acidoterrestris]UNO48757.1 4'-phosphopantetheinyl transferase superfamily protein [Alicyclobacillus acidoterrestris]